MLSVVDLSLRYAFFRNESLILLLLSIILLQLSALMAKKLLFLSYKNFLLLFKFISLRPRFFSLIFTLSLINSNSVLFGINEI